MMSLELTAFLGSDVAELLKIEPFSGWRVVRSVEHEPKEEIWYEFEGHGVEVICDGIDRIKTIFLHRGDGESLAEIRFSMRRLEVLKCFGDPEKSGKAVRIPGIGDRGAWDRFTVAEASIHIQYRIDCDEIDLITIMRQDAVP